LVLLLIALGGAGLAVAADRAQNPVQRPELTWRADQAAAPWIDDLTAATRPVDEHVTALSEHALNVLANLTTLDVKQVEAEIAAGDEEAARVQESATQLAAVRDQAVAAVPEWRLGQITRGVFDQFSIAATAAQQVPGYWSPLTSQARLVTMLITTLSEHDDLVFQATAAGRESRWGDALSLLDQADEKLTEASSVRDELAAQGETGTLDDLLTRYVAYDRALSNLYGYIADTGTTSGPEFEALQKQVDDAQHALPQSNSALTVIVAEVASKPIAEALVNIERAHGDILDALAAVEEPTTEPDQLQPLPTSMEIEASPAE
jgi:hypothetical protein